MSRKLKTEPVSAAGPHQTELTTKRLTHEWILLHTEVSAARGPLSVSVSLSLPFFLVLFLSISCRSWH